MSYYSKELIARAREMDLLTYLRCYNPGELVRISPNVYSTKSHGSLKISNGKWMWWAQNIGGISALDYLSKVEGVPFVEAVKYLLGLERVPVQDMKPVVNDKKESPLPPPGENNDRVIAYLYHRGIDMEILYDCIAKGLLYEAKPYHNAIFIGKNDEGKAAYGAYRSTNDKRILGEIPGSSKEFSFRIVNEQADLSNLHVFESAIDALSFLSIRKLKHRSWREDTCLSLGGVAVTKEQKLLPALKYYLDTHGQTRTVTLHLDNDDAGKKAAAQMWELLKSDYDVVLDYPKYGKDMNDELRELKRKVSDRHQR